MNLIQLLGLIPGFGSLTQYLAYAKNASATLGALDKAVKDAKAAVDAAIVGTPVAGTPAVASINAAFDAADTAIQAAKADVAQLGL